METQVLCKGYLPAYYPMSYLSEDLNNRWPLHHGERIFTNVQYCNGFMSRTTIDSDPGYDKDILKQKILEHEETFKNQVYELHRLYKTQRDMMYEIKRTELPKPWTSMEPSSSSSILGSHLLPKDAWKCHTISFPLANSSYARPSMSGTEIVNSAFSSSKVNSVPSGQVQMQSGCSSKICESLEARPSKLRKMFDLQLPADEYIDTDEVEQLRDDEGSFYPSFHANGNHKVSQDSCTRLLPGACTRSDKKDSSASHSCLRSSVGLADLNEPAQLEETISLPVDFLGYGDSHKEIRKLNASAKSNPAFAALPRETTQNSHYTSSSKGKERDWFSSTYETGKVDGSSTRVPHSLSHNNFPTPRHLAQVMLDKAFQHPGVQSSHCIRDDRWKERRGHGLETFHGNHEKSDYTYGRPFITSRTASPYSFSNSSEVTNSLSHTLSYWGKPSGFSAKLSSGHTNPSLNSCAMVGKSLKSPSCHDSFGDKWHIDGSSRPNLCEATNLSIRNGFYHGFSSGPKESPRCFSVACDSQKQNKSDNLTSNRSFTNGCEKFLITSNNMDLTSEKGFDLNVVSKDSVNEELSGRDLELVDEKREAQGCKPVLPWLKAKSFKNENTDTVNDGNSAESGFIEAYTNSPICGNGPLKKFSNFFYAQNVASAVEDHNMKVAKELGETPSVRKILGVPAPEIPCASKNESSSFVSTSATLCSSPEEENSKHEGRRIVVDINIACDLSMVEPEKQSVVEAVVAETARETKATIIRNCFDLNSCITEDNDPFFVESNNVNVRTVVEIDLEAPLVLETELGDLSEEKDKQNEASLQLSEHKPEQTPDEVVRFAAEAIVAISSSSQIDSVSSDPSDDPLGSLGWFVSLVVSFENELESKSKEIIVEDAMIVARPTMTMEMDYFEAMTLQLEETKEQDYLPKPFVREVQPVEDAGATSLTNRTRRGHGRWGRQRKNFQRDILPGLTSLSRHEVTEDMQTFGELMRATGHSWNSGSKRRNGGMRGRQKVVIETTPVPVSTPLSPPLKQKLSNIVSSLEDKSLTGWGGKTTRRPRRQRCPAGHPPAVLLTKTM